MIIGLEREMFQVLTMNGQVVVIKPQELEKRRNSIHAVSLDGEQNSIRQNDVVKVIDGPHTVSISFFNNECYESL